jgi:hypothetical protein
MRASLIVCVTVCSFCRVPARPCPSPRTSGGVTTATTARTRQECAPTLRTWMHWRRLHTQHSSIGSTLLPASAHPPGTARACHVPWPTEASHGQLRPADASLSCNHHHRHRHRNHNRHAHTSAASTATRAALLTGRTNERSCIYSALKCDQEDPAMTCSMGAGRPHSEITIADAAARSPHNYMSIMIGKCECAFFSLDQSPKRTHNRLPPLLHQIMS